MQQLQIMPQSHTFYSARCGVLWSTRLSVCPWTYPWNRWTDLRAILCADPMWLWLGPPPWHCPRLCTSGFMDDVTLAVMGTTPKGGGCTQWRWSMTWRYRGRVWCLWMLVSHCGKNESTKQISTILPTLLIFLTSGHYGAQSWVPECPNVKKLTMVG